MGRTALLGVLAVWFGLTLLMSMFTLLDQLGETSGGVSLQSVFYYVLLKAPGAAYVVFPVASLLGALIGVGALAAANELVAFRTAGASRLRISGSGLGAVLVLTLGVMALGEWVMPPAEAQALYDQVLTRLRERHGCVAAGQFGADMQVSLVNDGPVTFMLEVTP